MLMQKINGNWEKAKLNKLRKDNPNVSFPKVFDDFDQETKDLHNLKELVIDAKPAIDVDRQRIELGPIVETSGVPTRTWNVVQIPLEEVRTIKLGQLKSKYNQKAQRPLVDTGLGFNVHGGYNDLADFQVGYDLSILGVRASDNTTHPVTLEQLAGIITSIKTNGLAIKSNKWQLEDQIKAASTVDTILAVDIDTGWP